MRFDLVTLNLVLAIAETRSITRGAEREHLALAAASKRLSDLETRLGVTLFERRARGVEPTEAGRALVRHIRSLNSSLHALESEVVEFARGVKGHLRLVANVSAIADCLPPALAHFSREHPLIRISLEDQTSAEVQASLAEGRADVGIFVPPVFEARLVTWHYAQGQLSVIVPDEHPLAEREHEGVAFDDLLDYDVVGLHSGAAAQEQLQQLAAARGRTLKARLQVRGFDAIAQLVEAGLGVAVLPSAAAERFCRLFRIKRLALKEDWAEREYLLAVHAQEVLPAVVRRFVETLCPGSMDKPGEEALPAAVRQAHVQPAVTSSSHAVETRENSQPQSK
ncbi:MAG TPA: LysR family transcriptional regulator [Burkholderiaceae bacterium]|nr:LysR family transcriptional regulator [Burkholderiaceae bacterium]